MEQEKFYQDCKEGKPSEVEIFDFLSKFELEPDLQEEIEDDNRYPLISVLIKNYPLDFIIELSKYPEIPPANHRVLFDDKQANGEHPYEVAYLSYGVEGMFKLIDQVYNRNYDLLFQIYGYQDPCNLLDYLTRIERGKKLEAFEDQLVKYQADFDYQLFEGMKELGKKSD